MMRRLLLTGTILFALGMAGCTPYPTPSIAAAGHWYWDGEMQDYVWVAGVDTVATP